jgi:uncharacterized protein involved in exopolysaccharide biosynthesis
MESIENRKVAFLEFASLFYRRKALFLIPAVLITVLSLALSTLIPRKYQSRTITKITDPGLLNELLGKRAAGTNLGIEGTLEYELKSWERISKLVTRLRMDIDAKTSQEREDLIEEVSNDLKVDLLTQRGASSQLILIQFLGKTPSNAQEFVTDLTGDMIENTLTGFKSQVKANLEKKQAEVRNQQVELNTAEKAKREFEEVHQADLAGQDPELQARKIATQNEYEDVKLRVFANERKLIDLDEELKKQTPTIELPDQQLNPRYELLKIDIQKATALLEELRRKCQERHPLVKAQKEKIEKLEKQLLTEPEYRVNTRKTIPNPTYETLHRNRVDMQQSLVGDKERRGHLRDDLERLDRQLSALPMLRLQYNRLNDTYNRSRDLLNNMKVQEAQALLSWDQVREQADQFYETIENGRLPIRHAFPSTLLVLIVSLALGIGAGLGAVFLTEAATTTFRTLEEIKGFVKVPVMGAIHSILSEAEIRRVRHKRAVAVVAALIVAVTGSTLIFLYNRFPERLPDFIHDGFNYVGGAF